jgi:hypothetical protein
MCTSHGLHGRHMNYEQCFDFDLIFMLLYIHIVTYATLYIYNYIIYIHILYKDLNESGTITIKSVYVGKTSIR